VTPERVTAIVRSWVRTYTRHLPPHAAGRRIDELDSDLHEHVAQERAAGRSDAAIARQIASRALRGLPDDVLWRRHELLQQTPSTQEHRPMSRRAAATIVIATIAVLLVPAIAMATGSGADWGVLAFVLAALLVGATGVVVERLVRRPPELPGGAVLAAASLLAMVLGEVDDAPGLVGLGLLLLSIGRVSTRSVPRRRRRAMLCVTCSAQGSSNTSTTTWFRARAS
jgi:hypothetical protein